MDVRVLGSLEVVADGRPLSLGGGRQKAVLALLVTRANRVVPADVLVDELWAGDPPEGAAATLQVYVSRLRKALAPGERAGLALVTRRPGYALEVDGDRVDASRFERLVAEGRAALAGGSAAAASAKLAEGLALWRGPALADFAYEPFAQAEIARLEELRLVATEARVDADLALGRHAELVGEIEALVAAAPLRERLTAQLVTALYRSGRQAEALRAYARLRRRLGEELGIEPSAALVALEEAVLLQRADLDWRPPSATAAPALAPEDREATAPPLPPPLANAAGRGPFLGREAEVTRGRTAWERAAAGRPGLVLVTGPAGIGKTRLSAELARSAHAGGAAVLYGRCDEEPLAPYQPFVEALGDYVSACPTEDLRALEEAAADLARLVPAAARRLPGVGEPAVLGAEAERFRLFEAVNAFLAGAARRAPILVVLDDLHWADTPSVLLLKHLVRRLPAVPVLVVATCRDADLGADHPLAAALVDLKREDLVWRLALGGLGDDEVVGLVRHLVPDAEAADAARAAPALRRVTRGNPFFLREVVGHLAETGALAGRFDPELDLAPLGLPEEVKVLVGRRLAQLSPAARRALTLAAVAGQEFDLGLLCAADPAGEDELLDALDEAVGARLVEEVPGAPDRFGFSHALLREVLYGQLTQSRRVRLHRQVGEALERLSAGGDHRLAELAHHFSVAAPAGVADRAVAYARRAGEQAASRVAYEEAARHYRRALDALEHHPEADDALRTELSLSLGEACNKASELAEGKAAFAAAAAAARRTGRADHLASAALGYGGPVPLGSFVEDERGAELLHEALGALGDGDSPARALVLGRLAQLSYLSGAREERVALCDRALAVARRSGDPATLAAVLNARHWALFGPDDLDDRLATAREIVRLGASVSDDELVLSGWQCLVHDLAESGDVEAAADVVAARDRLAADLCQPAFLWRVAVSEALCAATEGRFAEAERLIGRAAEAWRHADLTETHTVQFVQTFMLRWLEGRIDEQAPVLDYLVRTYPDRAVWRAVSAWAHAEGGRLDEARRELAHLAAAPGGLDALPRTIDWYAMVVGLAVAATRVGDPAAAAALYDALSPFAERNTVVGQSAFCGAVSHYLGLLAAETGRHDEAEAHFEAALERHRRMAAPPFVALTEHAYAGALLRRGRPADRDRAAALLRRALATADRLGMRGLAGAPVPGC